MDMILPDYAIRQKIQLTEAIDIALTNGLSFIVNLKEVVNQCKHTASSAVPRRK